MERSRSPRHDPQWIARQVAMLGRYPEKRPKDLNVTCDGHMYLDDLIRAWGQQHDLQEEAVLVALRKYAARGEVSSRFTMTCTLGGRTLIKVSPKLALGSRPIGERHYTLPARTRAAPKQSPKCNLDVKSKLDMSLDDLIGSSHGRYYSASSSSSSRWKNGSADGSKTLDDATKTGRTAHDLGRNICANAQQDGKSARKWSLLDVPLNEAAGLLECSGSDKGTITAQDDERSARVRRSMEQMGLTPGTAHIRRKAGAKAALTDVTEIVDSSPSPPPSRGPVAEAGEDADDIALAACAARSLNVSGSVDITDAGDGNGKIEAPPRPPGGNWQQYFDSEDSSLWYFWPGPGGEWWCGPNEGDEPHPYKEGSAT